MEMGPPGGRKKTHVLAGSLLDVSKISDPAHVPSIANGTLRKLTIRSLVGLAVGLVVGIAIQRTQPGWGPTVLSIAEVLIRAWTNAFRLLVVPLVVAQLFLGMTMGREDKHLLGRVGAITPLVFAGLLLGTALLSWWATQALMQFQVFGSLSLVPADALPQAVPPGAKGAAWID